MPSGMAVAICGGIDQGMFKALKCRFKNKVAFSNYKTNQAPHVKHPNDLREYGILLNSAMNGDASPPVEFHNLPRHVVDGLPLARRRKHLQDFMNAEIDPRLGFSTARCDQSQGALAAAPEGAELEVEAVLLKREEPMQASSFSSSSSSTGPSSSSSSFSTGPGEHAVLPPPTPPVVKTPTTPPRAVAEKTVLSAGSYKDVMEAASGRGIEFMEEAAKRFRRESGQYQGVRTSMQLFPKKAACTFFVRGACTKGGACPYGHGEKPGSGGE